MSSNSKKEFGACIRCNKRRVLYLTSSLLKPGLCIVCRKNVLNKKVKDYAKWYKDKK